MERLYGYVMFRRRIQFYSFDENLVTKLIHSLKVGWSDGWMDGQTDGMNGWMG